MSGQIFISYRREESRWSAGRLYDRLVARFDRKQIFMDIDGIPLGDDFVEVIQGRVSECDILIAVIGTRWLTSPDEQGNRRLDNPEDFVRMEIATALTRGVRVIPVLVDGALIPRSLDLPDNLKPLVRRNALRISDTSFNDDCRRLIASLEQVLEKADAERKQREGKESLESKTLQHENEGREQQEEQAAPPVFESTPSQEDCANSPQVGVLTIAPSRSHRKPKWLLAIALALITGMGAIWFAVHRERTVGLPEPIESPTPTPGFSARAAYDHGQTAYKQENYRLAITDYTEAIQLDRDYADAFYARSLAYRSLGDIEKADADLAATGRLKAAGKQ